MKRLFALLLSLALVLGATTAFADGFSYPIDTAEELTIWMRLPGNVTQLVTNVGETPYMQELEARTGIKVNFLHPAAGQESEALNLLLASGDLPDMIEWDWLHFVGGPDKLIDDGLLIALNELMPTAMPNLSAYYEANPDIAKMTLTDTSRYYVVPFARGTELLRHSWGPVIRQDYLDKLGLAAPTTIDEWETVLRAFKENGIEKPFSAAKLKDMLKYGVFTGAYNALMDFYYIDGRTTHGVLQPGFKDVLLKLHGWYAEGLIDQDIATNDGNAINAGILSGKIGSTVLSPGSGIGVLTSNARSQGNAEFTLTGLPYPVLEAGTMPMYDRRELPYPGGSGSSAITSACANPELAARWLDFGWSEAGSLFANFGIEDVSYEMVDGKPQYTELLLNNPDGLTVATAMAMYCRSNYGGPFAQAEEYLFQYMTLPEQQNAILTWMESDTVKYQLYPITPTSEEAETISRLMGDIDTYIDEMITKFILGADDIEAGYDSFVSTVKGLGLEQVIEIYDAATVRYLAR